MKLLYCEKCGDIIAPYRVAMRVRWCECQEHAVWWRDPRRGWLSVHDRRVGINKRLSIDPMGDDHCQIPNKPQAFVLGVTNVFLGYPGRLDANAVQAIIDTHDDTYIFKQIRSPIIRVRPGESNDTKWDALPEEEILE